MFQTDIIENFWASGLWRAIKYTGFGMLGIFVVTGIIIAVVYGVNYFLNMDSKNESAKNED